MRKYSHVALQNINKKDTTRPVVIQSPTHHFVPLPIYFHIFVLHLHPVLLQVYAHSFFLFILIHIEPVFFNFLKEKNRKNRALTGQELK